MENVPFAGETHSARQRSAKRVIFVNRYFYPDHAPTGELLAQLAFALAGRGFDVAVVTSRLHYETQTTSSLRPHERIHDVDVWRVWTSRHGRQRLVGRSFDYLTFYVMAGWRVLRLSATGDTIVVMTDPPLMSVVLAPIAWLKGASLVNWLQDIFPEVAQALKVGGSVGRVTFGAMRRLRNWSLTTAKLNVVVGEGMARYLETQRINLKRLRVISNWASSNSLAPVEKQNNALRKSWSLDTRFVVGYAGNLGRAHDIETIVDALTLMQARARSAPADNVAARIMFVCVGGGARRAELERKILQRKLTNVRLFPYQPREQLSESLSAADVHIVSLNPHLEGLIVPSKFFGIAAAGRPVIFIGSPDGEIARLIKKAGCGVSVAPGDGAALRRQIIKFARDPKLCARMGARARAAFEKYWNEGDAVANWEDALSDVEANQTAKTTAGQWRAT